MKILVAISDSFPYGAAYAARTRALCKLFRAAGYETDVLCDYIEGDVEISEYGTVFNVSDGPYVGLRKLLNLPRDFSKKLNQLLHENQYDYVVARSMFDRFGRVVDVALKHNVPVILESCEWYDVRGFRKGRFDIRYHQFCRFFKFLDKKADGVIAISRLLEEHYKSKGMHTVRIPGIHDVEKLPYRIGIDDDTQLKLIFGGNIFGGKEQFSQLLEAIYQMKAENKDVFLHMYGSSEQEVLDSLDDQLKKKCFELSNAIIFHGRVPQAEMAQACLDCDLGVFFRPDRRSSHAGFPTKLGEYLSAGTPVMTNDTGDISLVLKDGENGFLLTDNSVDSIKKALEKYLDMSKEEKINMRRKARNSAMDMLDYRCYAEDIKTFFDYQKI